MKTLLAIISLSVLSATALASGNGGISGPKGGVSHSGGNGGADANGGNGGGDVDGGNGGSDGSN